jgi:hypothetical protein
VHQHIDEEKIETAIFEFKEAYQSLDDEKTARAFFEFS